MLRLDPTKARPAVAVEPSQNYCPHWILVVLQQNLRFFLYLFVQLFDWLRRFFRAKCGSGPPPWERIKEGALRKGKRVIFVRHGQGAHNASMKNWGLIDPELDAAGEAQVVELNGKLAPYLNEVELVVSSPLTRALQTATGGFSGCKAKWCLLPLLRERLGAPCDTGRTKSDLLATFPELKSWEGVAEMEEIWWTKSTCQELGLFARVEAVKQWLHKRPEQVIGVVGHGGFFTFMVGYHLKNCGFEVVEWSSPDSSEQV